MNRVPFLSKRSTISISDNCLTFQITNFVCNFRSGSIEGVSPTLSGPSLLSTLSQAAAVGGVAAAAGAGDQNNATSVGTWKLIKGKVSQTIEDIKSSKHHSSSSHSIPHSTSVIPIIVAEPAAITTVGWTNEPDSDTECITMNTSASEEQQQQQHNSDSDAEAEQLQHDNVSLGGAGNADIGAATIERSRLRRGLAHIKSKVKAKQQSTTMGKKEQLPNIPSQTGQRSTFLRRRHNADQGEATSSAHSHAASAEGPSSSGQLKRGIVMARKDVEIESGVEVLEDMIPPVNILNEPRIVFGQDSQHELSRDTLDLPLKKMLSSKDKLEEDADPRIMPSTLSLYAATSLSLVAGTKYITEPTFIVISMILLSFVPMPDFLRGVLTTIFMIFCLDYAGSYIRTLFEKKVLTVQPEHVKFQIPNYQNMPICEIPAVEEHKTVKTYAGWMNEIDSYDPLTFSFNMTTAVYVRLDGSMLKLSATNARIPKRRMWNEPFIDRNKILFHDHRSYDLRDARIELLPLGLAKKRYFNRKYPIQVIIKDMFYSVRSSGDDQMDSKPLNLSPGTVLTPVDDVDKLKDFSATVLKADLQLLRNHSNPDYELQEMSMPCGDEIRLLLFARCDREKEDWYRRFIAASKGHVHEQDLQVPMAKFVDEADLQAAAAQQAVNLTLGGNRHVSVQTRNKVEEDKNVYAFSEDVGSNTITPDPLYDETRDGEGTQSEAPDLMDTGFEGLIMNADVARNSPDYIKFMAVYQQACRQSVIPVIRKTEERSSVNNNSKRHRRAKRQEDELWKGIDQTLFLGPSGSVVWANIIMGRCLYSWLHDTTLHGKIQDILQKKLNSVKLPSFMEDVMITNIYLGESPLLFHRISQPMMDERGTWLDADITYEGLGHITLTAKLNLLRVRAKPKLGVVMDPSLEAGGRDRTPDTRSITEDLPDDPNNAIYDSDAESSGGSSTEEESPPPGVSADAVNSNEFFQNSPGNARRIFKIVDRIATSNLFQYASELPYVQRAMENMSANITLRVELKGMVARGTLNIPPPPSDRVWLCFRGPPRLWISTKPQVGDKSVDWSIVTNVIESKLCEAVNKFLVYPNMVDFTVPFLAKPNYDDEGGSAPAPGTSN